MDERPGELPDPVIMRIIRRFLDSVRAALGPFPLLNAGAKKSCRSPSPPKRASSFDDNEAYTSRALDLDAKAKNRLDSSPNSKNSGPSELDLDAKTDGADPSAEVHGAARPTGLAARRRRQHQNRRQRQRAAADPDAKNAAADQECSVELEAATKTTACDPKHAAPSPELYLVAKSRKDAIAAKKKRQRNNRRERRRAATDLGQERSAELATAKATAPEPKPLAVATTSTTKNTVVSKKKWAPPAPPRPDLASAPAAPQRCTRPSSTSLPEHRPPAAATVVRQCSNEPDDDECRARHHRYKEACSSLLKTQSNFTYCLVCFLKDDRFSKVPDSYEEMKKHLRAAHGHSARWIKCEKRRCYAMASRVDISHHYYYAHQRQH